MELHRPKGLYSGLRIEAPDPDLPEMSHVGEQWSGREFIIPRHSHPTWEFYYQLSGRSTWQLGSSEIQLEPNQLLAVEPDLEHELMAQNLDKHHYFFVGVDLVAILSALPELKTVWAERRSFSLTGSVQLQSLAQSIMEQALRTGPFRSLQLRTLLHALITTITDLGRSGGKDAELPLLSPGIQRAKNLIELSVSEPLSLKALAEAAGFSPPYFSTLFKQEVGLSPHHYAMGKRIAHGRYLLRSTDMPIVEIALECGFSSSQHMASTFRKHLGRSPSAIRSGDR
tara:strand:- start:624 stop:1475 length:852 start_codon:yes stop_codon:yes gene_type:complete